MQCALASSRDGQLTDDTSVLVLDILRPDKPDFTSFGTRKLLHNRVVPSILSCMHKGICDGHANMHCAKRCLCADVDGVIEYPELDESQVLVR